MVGLSAGMTNGVRVVVVDDQPLIRQALTMVLGSAQGIVVVGQGASAVDAVTLAETHRPDVTVVKANLSSADGVAATEHIVRAHPAGKVLVLAGAGDTQEVAAALEAGADGCIAKDGSPQALVSAVHVIASGESVVVPQFARAALKAGLVRPRRPEWTSDTAHLTPRERDVLQLVGMGLSNGELAAHLGLAEPTVKSHVSRLRHRLGLRDRAQMVVCAYELGLVTVTVRSEDVG